MRLTTSDQKWVLIWGLLYFWATSLHAEQAEVSSPCSKVVDRPCVALVLGGGGARGGAHLGVIRYLEEQQIPVDIVIGTSIGAFVGGLYASGNSPEQIEHILTELPWSQGFQDRVQRHEKPARRKQQQDAYPIQLELGIRLDGVHLPKGVLHGQAMAELLQRAYGVQANQLDFDELAIPFRAVAADLVSGEAVVLAEGSLLQAVQASMSIPGVVSPMEVDQRILVDGGVANNLPVDVAKALGAERVIAVSIDAPLLQKEDLTDAFSVSEQLTNFLVRRGLAVQLALLNEQDILLQPELGGIGTLDFEQLMHGADIGYQTATSATALQSLAVPASDYHLWLLAHRLPAAPEQRIDRIVLQNQSALDDHLLLTRLGIQAGDPYDSQLVEQGVRRLYGLDVFERVSQQLTVLEDDSTELQVQVQEKSWGPGYLNFRLRFEEDFQNMHHYQLAASYLYTNLSPLGAEWYSELAIGSDKLFSSELYWPLLSPATFVSGTLSVFSERQALEDSSRRSLGNLNHSEFNATALAGWHPSDHFTLASGWTRRAGRYRAPGSLAEEQAGLRITYQRQGPLLQGRWDTLDNINFPGRGIRLSSEVQWLQDRSGGERGNSRTLSLDLLAAKSWQAHRLHTRWRWQRYRNNDPELILEQFSLGGFLNLSGYPHQYLYGSTVSFGSLVYQYQLSQPQMSFLNMPWFVGGSIERGRVQDDLLNLNQTQQTDTWLWAGSLFLGWDSPLGPLFFGYGRAESDARSQIDSWYLSLGHNF
ncbi:patatin-like phospholipase family protein [Alkalimonas collagenimarina]|uniref:Patatin-like phospholipase family protein n=1 Tax=Alkalimonas collagenimarina TaxID=400390 RepID=A0ABT9GYJ6_9GAMM|nr:patatin-like phospholipase family protein [Alkalimonas collagenimarina]MDP4536112.1 patatin-like phospholipase family protein [Alkalimonas collagenimarina]